MKSFIIVFITLFLAGGLSTAGAVSRTATIYQTIDKASLPTYLSVWQGELSRESDSDKSHVNDTLVCQSSTDSIYGACPTQSTFVSVQAKSSPIRLTFTDSETRSTTVLTIMGVRCPYQSICYANGGATVATAPWNGYKLVSSSIYAVFTYWIPKSELAKLTPGVWSATLQLSLKNLDSSNSTETDRRGTWTANMTLTVKDITAPQIYFPAFPSSTPSVNLNLSNLPGTDNNTTASGSNTLDMCLYDGRDSASSSMTLLFKDSVGNGDTTGRSSGLFSLFQYNVTAPSGRLDYQVSFVNPVTGSTQVVANGTPITLDTSQSGVKKRRVTLPGFSDISICIPAPLTLDTPSFVLSSKYQGNYFGTLIVIYTPSTS